MNDFATEAPRIAMLDQPSSTTNLPTLVEFVGGPRDQERLDLAGAPPATLAAIGAEYRRSVRCADDARLRYVWRATDQPR